MSVSAVPDETYQIRNPEAPGEEVGSYLLDQVAGAGHCLRQMETETEMDAAIHQLRKQGKRIRGVLRLIRPGIPEGDYGAADALARGFAKWFSDARDALVMRETWGELSGENDGGEIAGALEKVHRMRLEEVRVGVAVRESARQLDLLETVVRQIPAGSLSHQDLLKGMELLFVKGAEEFSRALETRCPEDLHAWRKRAKYLSFHYELLGVPASRDAADLGSTLGRHHDLAVLSEWLKSGPEAPSLLDTIADVQAACEESAFSLGRELFGKNGEAMRA